MYLGARPTSAPCVSSEAAPTSALSLITAKSVQVCASAVRQRLPPLPPSSPIQLVSRPSRS
eukprot:COSAG01_NODE_2742_length_7152_cov_9.268538_5_plen_61_part_00